MVHGINMELNPLIENVSVRPKSRKKQGNFARTLSFQAEMDHNRPEERYCDSKNVPTISKQVCFTLSIQAPNFQLFLQDLVILL